MPIIQRPAALGLMLCDQVLFEHNTQKPTLVGIFTGIAVDGFPSGPQRFDLFAALTDGIGEGVIDLVVYGIDGDQQLHAQSMELAFPDPFQIINLRFRFRQLSFPAGGAYLFTLLVEGEEIAHRRLQVHQIEELS